MKERCTIKPIDTADGRVTRVTLDISPGKLIALQNALRLYTDQTKSAVASDLELLLARARADQR